MTNYPIRIDLVALGINIKTARKKMGLTQSDVANHVGVSRTLVVAWEQGTSRISVDQLALVSQLFCLDVAVLTEDVIERAVETEDGETHFWRWISEEENNLLEAYRTGNVKSVLATLMTMVDEDKGK